MFERDASTLPWLGWGTPGGGNFEPRPHLLHHVRTLFHDGDLAGPQLGGDLLVRQTSDVRAGCRRCYDDRDPELLPDPRLQIMAPPFRLVLYETDRETRRIPSRKGSEFVSRRATSDSRVDHLGALGRLVTSTWSSRFRPRLPHARSTIGGPRPGMRKGTHTSPACTAFLALSAAASIALRCFWITMPETSDARHSAAPADVAAARIQRLISSRSDGGRRRPTNFCSNLCHRQHTYRR